MDIGNKVKELISEKLNKENIDVINVIYEKEANNYFLRVIIDSKFTVDIDTCIKATNIINPILDNNEDIFDNKYILDVCSKGGN